MVPTNIHITKVLVQYHYVCVSLLFLLQIDDDITIRVLNDINLKFIFHLK